MIDYKKISHSLDFYNGFIQIEVPWWVSEEIIRITAPPHAKLFPTQINDKFLVASAEQSFQQLIQENKLTRGKYKAVTPCFRDDKEDKLHQKYFIKTELIDLNPINEKQALNYMLSLAEEFFRSYYIQTKIEKTYDERSIESFDIFTLDGVELGSYGIRNFNSAVYVYGTGCAEPRLSIALGEIK